MDLQPKYRKVFLYSIISYVILFGFSIVYYKERTVFTDIAYHMFMYIRYNAFAIQNFRFAAYLTQVFPVMAQRFGLPLNSILLIYSAGFIICYFTFYLLMGLVLKNYKLALVLVLFNTLFVAHTFFWIQSELPQGMALLILTTAFALKTYDRHWLTGIVMLISCFSIFIVAMSHPLLRFPAFYLFAFLFIDKSNKQLRIKLVLLTLAYIISLWIKAQYFQTEYETKASHDLNFFLDINYLQLHTNDVFFYNCTHKYIWIPVLFLASLVLYACKRQWLKLALVFFFTIVYLMIVHASFPDASAALFYMENMYLPIAVFLALPFVYDILPLLANKKLAIPLILLFPLTLAVNIRLTHKLYGKRLNWERHYIEAHKYEKLIVDQALVPMDTLIMTWATPYEFWLLSTTEQGRTASLVINEAIGNFEGRANETKKFIGPWEDTPYSELDPRYFNLPDTLTTYRLVK